MNLAFTYNIEILGHNVQRAPMAQLHQNLAKVQAERPLAWILGYFPASSQIYTHLSSILFQLLRHWYDWIWGTKIKKYALCLELVTLNLRGDVSPDPSSIHLLSSKRPICPASKPRSSSDSFCVPQRSGHQVHWMDSISDSSRLQCCLVAVSI